MCLKNRDMKQKNDMDILKDRKMLKDNPFVVPEGYFEAMRERASRIPEIQESRDRKIRRVLVRVLSAAASVALVLSGMLLFDGRRAAPEHNLYSDNVATVLSSDEIIEYLIYTGASVEDINAVGGM